MKTSRSILIRLLAIAGLAWILNLAFSENKEAVHSWLDMRAVALVLLAPPLVLILFQNESARWSAIFGRIQQLLKMNTEDLSQDLIKNTRMGRSQFGFSHIVKLTDNHSDSLVRYASELYSARFNSEEMAKLLVQRVQAEDAQWQSACSSFGFLAKMAPYFGMLATVIGMIQLLHNMSDLSQISGSMALAMQGTLYGLISFTLIYAPLQKLLIGYRAQIAKRNEMVARWFVLLSQQQDPSYIEQEIKASNGLFFDLAPSAPVAAMESGSVS